MFTKKNNLIELNFNGVIVMADPVQTAIAINETNRKTAEKDSEDREISEEYVLEIMLIINDFLIAVTGEKYEECMKSTFEGGEAGFYDMIDLFQYVRNKYLAFEKGKRI